MYHITSEKVDAMYSPEHRVVYSEQGGVNEILMQDLYEIDSSTFDGYFITCEDTCHVKVFDKDTKIQKVKPKDGFKYCFTVPSSYWVMRRNGFICVTGNSGKSVLAMNQALHSYKDGADVLYMNLELAKNEQMARMLSCIYDLDFSEIYQDLSEEKLKEFNKLKEDFFNKPNKFKMVNSTMDAEFIKNAIKTEAKTGLDLVVIDYLQIVKNVSNIERWKFLENFVQELHQISLDLGVVILTPVQINKSDVKEKKGEYHITPRGSRELEFSSSLFFFLTQNEEEAKDNIMRLITIKARQSKKHTYILEADLNYMKFKPTGLVI